MGKIFSDVVVDDVRVRMLQDNILMVVVLRNIVVATRAAKLRSVLPNLFRVFRVVADAVNNSQNGYFETALIEVPFLRIF